MSWTVIGFWIGLCFWAWFVWRALRRVRLGKASASWPTVTGTVVASKIEEVRGKGGAAYNAKIRFEYAISGDTFSAKTPSFKSHKHSYGVVRSMTKRYPRGHRVQVYYNPQDPQMAVLEPGGARETVIELVLLCVMLGMWIVIGLAI